MPQVSEAGCTLFDEKVAAGVRNIRGLKSDMPVPWWYPGSRIEQQ